VEVSVRSNEVGDDVRLPLVLLVRRGRRGLCVPAALLSLVKPPPNPPSEVGFFFRRGMSADGAEALAVISILFFSVGLIFGQPGEREKR